MTARVTAYRVAVDEYLDELLDTLHDYRQCGKVPRAEDVVDVLRDMADEIERTTGDPDRWLWEWRSSHPVDEGDYDGDDWRRDGAGGAIS